MAGRVNSKLLGWRGSNMSGLPSRLAGTVHFDETTRARFPGGAMRRSLSMIAEMPCLCLISL